MYNASRCGRQPDAMLFQVDAFDLPEWAHDELKAQCAERAIGVDELVKHLVWRLRQVPIVACGNGIYSVARDGFPAWCPRALWWCGGARTGWR